MPSTDWVDAGPARGHLLVLFGQGATRNALDRATGLSPKTIENLIDRVTKRVTPLTEQTVLACTMEAVRRASADMPGIRVDARPDLKGLIDDLTARGWPASWIAREAGLGRAIRWLATRSPR